MPDDMVLKSIDYALHRIADALEELVRVADEQVTERTDPESDVLTTIHG
jgi:hypothetical protein